MKNKWLTIPVTHQQTLELLYTKLAIYAELFQVAS